jgi:methylglutaconyl-CoA hydratase
MAEFVHLKLDRHTATITLHRPDLHNAFNDVLIRELREAFEDIARRPDVRVVVLAAEGKSFCAGADLNWMKRMIDYSFDENIHDARALADMLRAVRDCPRPVIARVHGAAIGGGVGIVAASDIAVAVEAAHFALTEVRLGLLPAVISPFVLEKIGPAAARRYFLTAERFTAVEAHRIGLVAHVAPTVAEMDAWIAAADDAIARNGPEAVAECKALIRDILACPHDRMAELTAERIARRRVSAEGQEGMKAFLDKRSPRWHPPGSDDVS